MILYEGIYEANIKVKAHTVNGQLHYDADIQVKSSAMDSQGEPCEPVKQSSYSVEIPLNDLGGPGIPEARVAISNLWSLIQISP